MSRRHQAFITVASLALSGTALAQLPAAAPVSFAPPVETAQATPPAATPAPAPAAGTPPILESETSDSATLSPATPHRFYMGTRQGGFAILDGDTAKIAGTINGSNFAVLQVAPDNKTFYVAETLWTKQNRGERQDLISIYDGTSLLLTKEIKVPGRLVAGGRASFFGINASGTRGFVYNMEPAPSVITVDLKKQAVLSTVEIPGCGLVYPFKDEGFVSLCADGSLASVALDAKGRGAITHSPVFFDVEKDPVFEESLVDRKTGQAFFITYTGVVHPATLGATTQIGEAWSLQGAAGLGPATTEPQHKTWRPGGRRPFAYHAPSGKLFVLMHEGKHWTQKEAGTQIWVYDTAAKKLISRFELPTNGYVMAVSQDADPQLYVVSEDGWFWVIDPTTGKILRNRGELGRPSLVAVTGF